MNLYLDASALVKRYVSEPGSDLLREAMSSASAWLTCRVAFLETVRAVSRESSAAAVANVRDEWPMFGVVEIDQALVEGAAELALTHELRSLDALHLAAALLLPREALTVATWDRRLHAAARATGLALLPGALD